MLYYVGEEFDVKKNKEYKTLDGAKKAADKAGLFVFDQEGVKIHPLKVELTDDVPESALKENPDGSLNTYNKAGEKVGTATPEEVKAAEEQITEEDIKQAEAAAKAEEAEAAEQEDEEESGQHDTEIKEEEVHGHVRRVFEGRLRLRRAPSFDDSAVCGVTMFDEKKAVKKITIGDRVLYQTADGYFISGDPKHVEFIPDQKEE